MTTGISNVNLNTLSVGSNSKNNTRAVGFSSEKKEYNNPVNPTLEKVIACTGPAVLSVGLGVIAGFMTKKVLPGIKNSRAVLAGAGVAALSGLMSIPGAWYSVNVSVPLKKEQYNVKEAELKALTNVTRDIKKESQDVENLDETLSRLFKAKMAQTGGVNINSTSM